MRLIKSTLTSTNDVAISISLCVKLMNRKLNDFITTSMHSLIDQFYVIFFDEDNDLIITTTLFIITTIKSSLISILFIEYRAIAKNKRRHS